MTSLAAGLLAQTPTRYEPQNKVQLKLVKEPKIEGFIKVGSPNVYSRQVLFRDRAEEIQYLSERLKVAKDFNTTFQGIVDSRTYEALGIQGSLKLDPLTGKLVDQTNANDLLKLQQQQQINELEAQINLVNAQSRLEEARKKLASAEAASADKPVTDEAAQNKINDLQGQVNTLKNEIDSLKKEAAKPVTAEANRVKPAKTDTDGPTSSKALNTGGLEGKTTTASLTPIEKEKAVLEVRRFLQNERRKLNFDDSHDARGQVAVDLGMMVTMMPPNGVDAYAVVEAYVDDTSAPDEHQLMEAWGDHLSSAIDFEKDFIVQRLNLDLPPTGDRFFELARQDLEDRASKGQLDIHSEEPDQKTKPGPSITENLKLFQMELLAAQNIGGTPSARDSTPSQAAQVDSSRLQKLMNVSGYSTFELSSRSRVEEWKDKVEVAAKASGNVGSTPDTDDSYNKPVALVLLSTFTPNEIVQLLKWQKAGDPEYQACMQNRKKVLLNRYLELYFGSIATRLIDQWKNQRLTGRPSSKGTWNSDELPDGAREEFASFLKRGSQRARVLAVEPTEQGQNISNVGATQSIKDVVLSLAAVLPQGVSGNGRLDYYRDSQLYLQSANRKPLAVGFANGSSADPSFGWILGPRYEVVMKRRWYQLGIFGEKRAVSTFVHNPTQHQVQVSMGVPTWLPELCLHLRCYWVDKKTGLPSDSLASAERIKVPLDPDYTALTEALLDDVHGKRRPPRIYVSSAKDKLLLSKQDDSHKLLLLGKDLWRSPSVYLDSRPADSVEVVPGLVGVVATFDGELPETADGNYDVTVSTMGGFDTLHEFVMTSKRPEASAPAPSSLGLRLERQTYVLEHEFAAAADKPLLIPLTVLENRYPMPLTTFLKAEVFPLGVYQENANRKLSVGHGGTLTITANQTGQQLIPSFDNLFANPTQNGAAKLAFNVRFPVQDADTGVVEHKDVVTGDHYVLVIDSSKKSFARKSKDAVTLGTTALTLSIVFPSQMPPGLFYEAYPDFLKACKNQSCLLEIIDNADTTKPAYLKCAMMTSQPQPHLGLDFVLPTQSEAIGNGKLPLDKDNKNKTFSLRLQYGDTHLSISDPIEIKIP
jgi:hypothetical protein